MGGPKHSAVIAVSGGLDSTTLLHYVVKEMGVKDVKAICFHYGQRHEKEIAFAEWQADQLGLSFMEVPLPMLQGTSVLAGSALVNTDVPVPNLDQVMGDPQPPTYVPFRNLVMLSCCLSLAEAIGASLVLYGAQRHDLYGYWDTTLEFVKAVNGVANLNRKHHIQVDAPFVDLSKEEVLRLGLEMGVDYSKTWSCYNGMDLACGTCPTCRERLEAFRRVGVSDPLPYSKVAL